MKKKLVGLSISLAIFFIFLELGLHLLSQMGLIQIGRPSYNFRGVEHFWNATDSSFGIWRKPRHEFLHMTSCFNVNYKANSEGRRDKESNKTSTDPRIVVLGDSYAEGWGVEMSQRFSDVLEHNTGMEFLNFGICNVGPTQEYLIYQNKAKAFEHDAILWSFFPENDFVDDDTAFYSTVHQNQYRSFWVGKYPNFRLHQGPMKFSDMGDTQKPVGGVKGLLRNFSYTYHLIKFIKHRFIHYTVFEQSEYLKDCGHFAFNQDQWDRMRYSIEKMLEAAGPRQVYIVTIPSKYDVEEYLKGRKEVPLRKKLKALSAKLGFNYYDILEEFDHLDQGTADQLYFDCDDHWNEKGHSWAASVMDSVFQFQKTVSKVKQEAKPTKAYPLKDNFNLESN